MVFQSFLAAILFILPAYLGNAVPVLFGGGAPIDCGKVLGDGKRLFGDGKTWRGLFAGLSIGVIAVGLLSLYLPLDYSLGLSQPQFALAGVLLCLGAQLGDIVGSYLKRRVGLPRGGPVLFLDQLLFLVFGLLFVAPIYLFPLPELVFLFALTLVVHRVANIMAYSWRLKQVPW